MKKIELANNKGIALVDDDDYDLINQYKWSLHVKRYAITNVKIDNKQVTKLMHRLIMNEPKNMQIDHKNHNGLDNQKNNLRIVTHQQNNMNAIKINKSSSIFKGVRLHKISNKWESRIQFLKKSYYLGLFKNEKDAAMAYNIKAKELFGEFATLNEI